jgi:hypothetical protein
MAQKGQQMANNSKSGGKVTGKQTSRSGKEFVIVKRGEARVIVPSGRKFSAPPHLDIPGVVASASLNTARLSTAYANAMLGELPVPDPTPSKPGADLVARLRKSGAIGAWKYRTDIGDSSEYARELRQQSETREFTEDQD